MMTKQQRSVLVQRLSSASVFLLLFVLASSGAAPQVDAFQHAAMPQRNHAPSRRFGRTTARMHFTLMDGLSKDDLFCLSRAEHTDDNKDAPLRRLDSSQPRQGGGEARQHSPCLFRAEDRFLLPHAYTNWTPRREQETRSSECVSAKRLFSNLLRRFRSPVMMLTMFLLSIRVALASFWD
mmetsp:Transcript_8373/g.22657  ORF Transcript_8373/g.22657 Transcript_8373/m.22657 type:complete len:180 (-) Transcript_8373:248-787(-)|eukprot:CAMPEP_0198112984 /NCGR_PEP_ID=MMETSP1442-20131203/4729_1 /TAXON_ID= /ORGANISM="Craspedostauros australis, Strain CCMP3328" /LENGTH=179 /DNA_ID=CAMNT_0043769947 /DNA_START=152 /DNA_END=691 /DNA_ORIENTATION=-